MATVITYTDTGVTGLVIEFDFYNSAGTFLQKVTGVESSPGVYTGTIPPAFVAGSYTCRVRYQGWIISVQNFVWSGTTTTSITLVLETKVPGHTANDVTAGQPAQGEAITFHANVTPSGKNAAYETNAYYTLTNERALLMDINRELISQYGIDVYYIKNPYTDVDPIYSEDRFFQLNAVNTKKIVVYLKNAVDGYEGGAFFSKFGFQNRQQTEFIISVMEWQTIFGTLRPLEGDIIYIPRWNQFGPTDFFRVIFIDKYDSNGYFPLGEHFTFTLTAEKWAYNSEKMATGVPEIDAQEPQFSADITVNPNLEAELVKDNATVQTIGDANVDWNVNNPFGRG